MCVCEYVWVSLGVFASFMWVTESVFASVSECIWMHMCKCACVYKGCAHVCVSICACASSVLSLSAI